MITLAILAYVIIGVIMGLVVLENADPAPLAWKILLVGFVVIVWPILVFALFEGAHD